MRFEKTKRFHVDDLYLDEGNYRFVTAADQKACVEKIYRLSDGNFRRIMTSIARSGLDQLLLVFDDTTKGHPIVMDGNRRLAALKVLRNPGEFAPTPSISKLAHKLASENKIDFTKIQTQISSNKALILETVYERHAEGNGVSNIDWTAYGAARFRFEWEPERESDWRAMAILMATLKKHPDLEAFIESSKYSHEVFRRIFRAAIETRVISSQIFSDRDRRIKKSVNRKLLNDAIAKTVRFLNDIRDKKLSLSRQGDSYADKTKVSSYLEAFEISSDNIRSIPPSNEDTDTGQSRNTDLNGSRSGDSKQDSSVTASNGKSGNGILRSSEIEDRLKKLKRGKKLKSLYYSLYTISLRQHGQLSYVGAWSFLEALSSLHGRNETTTFESYLKSALNAKYGKGSRKRKDCGVALDDIANKGNVVKHSASHYVGDGEQLKENFETLEELIVAILDDILSAQQGGA